jgi:hypothetical protein
MEQESILNSIKTMLNVPVDSGEFDVDLIIHINSVFAILTQLGVGPDNGFEITGAEEKWSDFVNDKKLSTLKTYVYMKVKLIFDPPTVGSVLDSYKELIREFEWRTHIEGDTNL